MKALEITHHEVSRETLLDRADRIPGAWLGIRIAGYLLILAGWKSTQVAELFGLSRNGVVKWIRKANQVGLAAVEDSPRPGRPTPLNDQILGELDQILSKSPREVGISRTRWDGVVVVEYLKRVHRIDIHVRHAQRLIRKLGYSLRQPIYRFVQASEQGVEEFRKTLKKNSTDDPE
ncbi:MAG: helix-turn-helix domain-containing protein [Deltaproteobacteria bacterium]|nr:helix-turn-helix domain-containing protein [Deltaproteobacteria bacterium]